MSTHLDALSPPARARVVLSCAARARRRWQGRRSRKLAGAEAAKPEPELLRASAGRSRVLPQEAAGGAAAAVVVCSTLTTPNGAVRPSGRLLCLSRSRARGSMMQQQSTDRFSAAGANGALT